MAVLSPGTSKNCVTCQHFNGVREPDAFRKSVRYDATCKGSCLLSKQKRAANSGGCAKWAKWATLK